jgi:hypothetical protein
MLSANAMAGENPNVSGNSPYAIGAYDADAKVGIGSGFRDAVAPGKVVGVVLSPLTAIAVVTNNVARGL